MAYPDPFTQAQLEVAVGGADKLLQLSKDTSLGGSRAQVFVAEVKAAAAGRLYSILQVAFDPADSTFQGADFVQQLAVTMGVYWAWHKSTGGIAVPDEVKTANTDAETMLKDAKDGHQSLGTSTDPTSNAGARTVEIDPTGTRIVRKNMGGFC